MKKRHLFLGIGVMALISAYCIWYSKKALKELVLDADSYEYED